MNYIKLLWRKKYLGLLIIMLCACLGSIRGAVKESREPFVDVTQEDVEAMEQAGDNAPDLVGIIPLAAAQNRWRNFSYALHYAGRGVVCYCVLMAGYALVCHGRGLAVTRSFFEKK